MTTALYRKSSNEVIDISAPNIPYDPYDRTYFGVLSDPPLTDGAETKNPAGESRILGYAKINDSGTIRNATQGEIDTFGPSETDDRNIIIATNAKDYLQNDPEFRKIITAIVAINLNHGFNKTFEWLMDLKTEVAASTSLANFQSRVAAMDNLPNGTITGFKTLLVDRISKDD